MRTRNVSGIAWFVGLPLAFWFLQSDVTVQVRPADPARGQTGIAGVYQMTLPGTGPTAVQVYFKDGKLRTVLAGESASKRFDPAEGPGLRFVRGDRPNERVAIEFLEDGEGRHTKFRMVDAATKLDVIATRTADFNDGAADPASPSDRQGYFERHYRKSEHRIPMRDGVRLFTQVFSPIDASGDQPIILFRTPYGIPPYGDEFPNTPVPSLFFAKEGYIIVFQDVRGAFMSEGEFRYFRPYVAHKRTSADVDESSDAYDTVDWLLRHVVGHNGKVGVWGPSYAGFTAAMAAIAAHPAVKAVSPQAPMADLFLGDDGHHNGALYLAHYVNYLYMMGQPRPAPPAPLPRLGYPTPDGYAFFLGLGPLKNFAGRVFDNANPLWEETMAHEAYDGYWKARSIYPHLAGITPALLFVGGWYDAEDLAGPLQAYREVERRNPATRNTLVMGPWRHSGWNFYAGTNENRGVFPFSGTIGYFQEQIELPFFNYYLKGKGALTAPEALVFETGTDRWRAYDAWPPREAREQSLFLADRGRLASDPPRGPSGAGCDEFLSDPGKPVPYTQETTARYNREYFVEDQRFAASRPDVLTYIGDVLPADVTVAGPIRATLYVSTTGTDADWVVKLIDVYPDDAPDPRPNPRGIRMGGYQRLVRGDIMRGKFRDSVESPTPFIPGRVTRVEFELPDVQHAFRRGHRMMIQVQSSWFPLFDRNPQTFVNIRTAGERDFQRATHRVYRTPEHPSAVTVRVLPGEPGGRE
jgi:putative CocE/NonD family hydrolase